MTIRTASVLVAAIISAAQPALYAEELPRHVVISDQAVGDLQARAILNLQPRMTDAQPVQPDVALTGAEPYTLDSLRSYATALHDTGLYTGTATDALEAVDDAANFGLVWKLRRAQVEESDLMMNWAFATLMGRSDLAATYMSELATFQSTLIEQETSVADLQFASERELADLFDASLFDYPLYAKYHSWALHTQAGFVRDFTEQLTDAADPERYIRQRLNKAHDDLILLAELITSLGSD